jgi:Fur family ferric uptake transcriptional regulator
MKAPHSDLDHILDELRADGERITTARRTVLETLLEAPDAHLTMDELAERVHERAPDIHLSTVYRTVEFLEQAGVLVGVRLGASSAAYHFASDHHHHARCDRCGLTIEIPEKAFDGVKRTLEREHGFVAHPHHVLINGLCRDCEALQD